MPMEYVHVTPSTFLRRLKACGRARGSRFEIWLCNCVCKYAGKGMPVSCSDLFFVRFYNGQHWERNFGWPCNYRTFKELGRNCQEAVSHSEHKVGLAVTCIIFKRPISCCEPIFEPALRWIFGTFKYDEMPYNTLRLIWKQTSKIANRQKQQT